jgi:hypothetical protein
MNLFLLNLFLLGGSEKKELECTYIITETKTIPTNENEINFYMGDSKIT